MIDRFIAYVMAFEAGIESDDWSPVGSFFTDDAIYATNDGPPFGGKREGREAILAFFKRSLNEFDRRFDSRDRGWLAASSCLGS